VLTHLWENGNCIMHMRTQYGYDLLPITRTCTCTCAYNTALPITCTCTCTHAHAIRFLLLWHSPVCIPTTWEHNCMDLAHNTARLMCFEYKEGEYNTCIGAACTSSIELTCSCACGRMALHVQTTTLGNLQSHARCVSCTYTLMHVPV